MSSISPALLSLCTRWRTQGCPRPLLHLILCAALARPVHRSCSFFIRKRINVHLICDHECRVESETEVSDHVVLSRLVLILLKELCRTGEGDLRDIFFYFLGCHSKSVVDKLHRLLFRIDDDLDLRLVALRELILSHHVQLFQLRDRIAPVGDQLTRKNIMVGIYPFLNDRKYILTVDR